ncbi:MAG: ABC transporter ATP-binding protein [Anaerolineaceae bacterium]|nr:ABC transporter ATP-binding protein [Anaerolineaceae bacterium]
MLELRTVTKKFGQTTAVSELNLSTGESEFVVIFGPAGAGKTTTLNLVAGTVQPTAGEILFKGQSLNGVPPEHRNMSMVFENYALYSHLSVYENIAFPLRARKFSNDTIKRMVHDMADVLQIGEFLDRRPGFLSGGQRQRVALGRALVRDADVYLLDEPISHLDAKLRHRMRGELKAMCAKKEAIILHVTHDYREAMALSDRMIVLNKSKVMQQGTPEEIYHWPANEFVASFVGEPPMSFLDVTYDPDSQQLAVKGTTANPVVLNAPDTPDAREALAGAGKLRVGVRASDVQISTTNDESFSVPAEVYVIETLGHQNIVTAKVGSDLVKIVTKPEFELAVRDTIWLNIGPQNYHLFADGKAISHPRRQVGEFQPA